MPGAPGHWTPQASTRTRGVKQCRSGADGDAGQPGSPSAHAPCHPHFPGGFRTLVNPWLTFFRNPLDRTVSAPLSAPPSSGRRIFTVAEGPPYGVRPSQVPARLRSSAQRSGECDRPDFQRPAGTKSLRAGGKRRSRRRHVVDDHCARRRRRTGADVPGRSRQARVPGPADLRAGSARARETVRDVKVQASGDRLRQDRRLVEPTPPVPRRMERHGDESGWRAALPDGGGRCRRHGAGPPGADGRGRRLRGKTRPPAVVADDPERRRGILAGRRDRPRQHLLRDVRHDQRRHCVGERHRPAELQSTDELPGRTLVCHRAPDPNAREPRLLCTKVPKTPPAGEAEGLRAAGGAAAAPAEWRAEKRGRRFEQARGQGA